MKATHAGASPAAGVLCAIVREHVASANRRLMTPPSPPPHPMLLPAPEQSGTIANLSEWDGIRLANAECVCVCGVGVGPVCLSESKSCVWDQ